MEKLKKSLQTEKMLKQQAVNKLAEIMNRKVINYLFFLVKLIN